MSLEFTKLDLWHINKQTFWTIGPILDIQNLISCWFIKFLVSTIDLCGIWRQKWVKGDPDCRKKFFQLNEHWAHAEHHSCFGFNKKKKNTHQSSKLRRVIIKVWNLTYRLKLSELFSNFYSGLLLKTREKSGMINACSPRLVKVFWSMGTLLPRFSWSCFVTLQNGCGTSFIIVFSCYSAFPQPL